MMLITVASQAQKAHYIPDEWKNPWPSDSLLYAESDPDNKYTWSESRSRETDNVIVYWDKGWGSKAPDELATSNFYYVDIDYLLECAEAFYQLECSQLGFVDPEKSNVSKYKVMVLMNHTTTWTCYGGGYDYMVPALWLNPSTCKPAGSAVAHEVGHSFHYMCYSEDSNHGATSGIQTGFHSPVGNGQCIWETTANWQSLQSYPGEILTMSGMNAIYNKSHNYAWSHEWHRYQAYPFLCYLTEYYGDVRTVADVWNYRVTTVCDFNEVLMKLKGLSAKELYKLHFDYAMHAVTWDIEAFRPYVTEADYGNYIYNKVKIADHKYQVAYSSAPQGTGFNVIPLNVPSAGETFTTRFTALKNKSALADGDPAEYLNGNSVYASAGVKNYNGTTSSYRGFRLGYVMLMEDGSRQYVAEDTVYCTDSITKNRTVEIATTVPEGVKQMWLVVAPSLKKYIQHKWDEDITNDDQWPYQVEFVGTDILGEPTLDGRQIEDVTLEYDVTMAPSSSDYYTVSAAVSGQGASVLGTGFQMQTTDINSKMVGWSTSGPAKGKIMFYAVTPKEALQSTGSTANGYGHWFNATGTAGAYNTGYVYSEFTPSTMTFSLGQYPGKNKDGDARTMRQALRYKDANGNEAIAYFVFNVTFKSGATNSATLARAGFGTPTSVEPLLTADQTASYGIYDLNGRRLDSEPQHGIYIKEGQKIAR